jgi:hypothetical protein
MIGFITIGASRVAVVVVLAEAWLVEEWLGDLRLVRWCVQGLSVRF